MKVSPMEARKHRCPWGKASPPRGMHGGYGMTQATALRLCRSVMTRAAARMSAILAEGGPLLAGASTVPEGAIDDPALAFSQHEAGSFLFARRLNRAQTSVACATRSEDRSTPGQV